MKSFQSKIILGVVLLSLFASSMVNAKSDKIVIGATLQDFSNEYIAIYADTLEKRAAEYPYVELILNDAQGDIELQNQQIRTFISRKVDAVIVCPRDANAQVPACKEVVEAGIPLIVLGAQLAEDIGVYSGTTNLPGGRAQGSFIVDMLKGKGNVALIRGPLGCSAEIGRGEGLLEIFKNYPDIKIIFDQTGNWRREEGMVLMENWLQTGKKIDAVVAQNDEMALGALEAIKNAGKLGEIVVIGIDGIPGALKSIKDGELNATWFQDPLVHSVNAIDMAIKAAKGQKIEEHNIPWEIITKVNVEAPNFFDRLDYGKRAFPPLVE